MSKYKMLNYQMCEEHPLLLYPLLLGHHESCSLSLNCRQWRINLLMLITSCHSQVTPSQSLFVQVLKWIKNVKNVLVYRTITSQQKTSLAGHFSHCFCMFSACMLEIGSSKSPCHLGDFHRIMNRISMHLGKPCKTWTIDNKSSSHWKHIENERKGKTVHKKTGCPWKITSPLSASVP